MSRLLALPLLLALLLAGASPAAFADADADETEAGDVPEHEEPEEEAEAEPVEPEEENEDEEQDSEEEDEREAWAREHREVRLDADEDGFHFESRHDERGDALRARFLADEAALEVEYEDEVNATEFEFRVAFRVLFEYEDADANGRYDVGEQVLRRIELPAQTWTFTVDPLAAGAQRAHAGAALPEGGMLSLRFVVTGSPVTVDGVLVRPTETKFDVLIDRFPFTSPTSRVGLETFVETELESEVAHAEAAGLTLLAGEVGGYYRWVNESIVDGRLETVGVSVLESRLDDGGVRTESTVVFAYAQGERIVHDPSVGVARLASAVEDLADALARGDARLWGAAAVGAAAAVAATALPRLRRGV